MVMFISVEIDLIEHWGATITIYILTMIIRLSSIVLMLKQIIKIFLINIQ